MSPTEMFWAFVFNFLLPIGVGYLLGSGIAGDVLRKLFRLDRREKK